MGYDVSSIVDEHAQQGVIPSHSYFFGAWVDAGILGALFWAVVFAKIPPFLVRYISVVDPASPVVVYFVVVFVWDIFFSPFNHQARITAAYSLVLVLVMSARLRATASAAPHARPMHPALGEVSR
jgi:O-antigen ligase